MGQKNNLRLGFNLWIQALRHSYFSHFYPSFFFFSLSLKASYSMSHSSHSARIRISIAEVFHTKYGLGNILSLLIFILDRDRTLTLVSIIIQDHSSSFPTFSPLPS